MIRFWSTLIFWLLMSAPSWADYGVPDCRMSRNYKFNFWSSIENNNQGMFGNTVDVLPPVVIDGCKGAGGKFLGIALGLRQPFLSSDTADISFDGSIRHEVCELKNVEASQLMSFSEKETHFKEQFAALRKCTYLEVTHLDGKNINYKSEQKFCHIEKETNGKLKLTGDFCYLSIAPDLRIAISVVQNENCKQAEYLKSQGIQLTDMEAVLQAFVVDDDQSLITQNLLGSAKVRLALLPPSNLVSVNKDIGPDEPEFPSEFAANIQMGSIKIYDDELNSEPASLFDLSLLVDSRGQRKCVNGLCASPADYQFPLVGEVELYQVDGLNKTQNKTQKRTLLDTWYGSNDADPFVKPQWQGLFSLGRKIAEGGQLKPGNSYELQINFYNPYDDYLMLVRHYQQMLIDLTLLNGTAGKDMIQPLSGLNQLLGLPQLPSLPALGTTDINDNLEKIRQVFRKLGADMKYPAYYESVCAGNGTCKKMQTKMYTQLITSFAVSEKYNADQSRQLLNLHVQRKSIHLGDEQHSVGQLPEIQCQ